MSRPQPHTFEYLTPAGMAVPSTMAAVPTKNSPCAVRSSWITAMNDKPTYTNLKNVFTPQFRARVGGYASSNLEATGGYSLHNANVQEAVRAGCTRPFPSYNASIPVTDCYPTF